MSKMLDEIREQPAALERTLEGEWAGVEELRSHLTRQRPRIAVLAARGTSDNAALFGRYLLEITTGIPVSSAAPSILTLYSARIELRDALVVAISQSGQSTDTNAVLEQAREAGAVTVGITNEPDSTLARIAEHLILVRAGREESVAATKTYTGQLLAMYLLSYALGAPVPRDGLRRLPGAAARALELDADVATLAQRYAFMTRAVSVARGLNYSNAFEFALKLMETCYVVAERFSAADLLHGPIAMVEHAFPSFLFAPAGVTWPGMEEMISKLQSLKAETLVITDRGNSPAVRSSRRAVCIDENLNDETGKLPSDIWTPIPYIIPAQLFAAHLAEEKGLDPDRPRTLSKVTLTM